MRALTALVLALACSQPPPPPCGSPAFAPKLDYLRHLGMDLTIGGKRVRAVALYANAPDYRHTASPARDGSEGVACVDDAARAALVYLRDVEVTGNPASREEASRLIDFVVAMEQGNGEWINFVNADGTPNRTSPTSVASFSYWAARALWALAEGYRVLHREDLRPVLDRAVARFARELDSGRLVGGSVTATSEALLGVLAYLRVAPTPSNTSTALRAAQRLVKTEQRGIHIEGEAWHAWGARAVQALAAAAITLRRPEFAESARREADGLWARFDRGVPAGLEPDGSLKQFPQIAYGQSPIIEGYLALADATGDRRYAVRAGKLARWFTGGNSAGARMYDAATGRTFDGIQSATAINRNAGAESNVEALLALEAIAQNPVAVGAFQDVEPTGRAEITYWPAANPIEVDLARGLAAEFMAQNPDVIIHVQPIPAGRSSEEVLLAAIVGHATPDVCSNINSALLSRLVRAQSVVRLDTLGPTAARLRERASDAMLAPVRLPDGGIYALPWKTNPMVLLYNSDLVAKPPRTYSELRTLFHRLAKDADGDGRLDHWALFVKPSPTWFERFYDFYPLYLAGSRGKTLVEHGKVAFDNEAAVAALELLHDGFAAHELPLAMFEGRDPFLDGTVAMKIVGPWFLQQLEELKMPGLHYEVAPVPVPDGESPEHAYAFGDLKSIAIFATTRHPDAAGRFVAFLTSPAADRKLVELAAQLPYRRSLTDDPRIASALDRWHGMRTIAAQVERVRDIDIDRDIVEVLDIVSEAYEAASVYGTVSPARAVHDAAREAREVLER